MSAYFDAMVNMNLEDTSKSYIDRIMSIKDIRRSSNTTGTFYFNKPLALIQTNITSLSILILSNNYL